MVEALPGMGCRPSKHARSRIRAAEAWSLASSQAAATANSFSNGAKARFPTLASSPRSCRTASTVADFAVLPVAPAAATANTSSTTGATGPCYSRRQLPRSAGQGSRPGRAEFTEFSTTTATYRRPGAGTARITVRLSKDGSTLEIEECELDSGYPCAASEEDACPPASRPLRRSASSPAVCVTADERAKLEREDPDGGRDARLPSRPTTDVLVGERYCHSSKSSTVDDVQGVISLSELEMLACECGRFCENGRTTCRSMPNHRVGVIVHKASASASPADSSSSPAVVQGECEVHASYDAQKESCDVISVDDVTSEDNLTSNDTSSVDKLGEMERQFAGRLEPSESEDGSSAAGSSVSPSTKQAMEVDAAHGSASHSDNPQLQRMASLETFTGSRTNIRRRPGNNPNRASLPANTEKRTRNSVGGPPPSGPRSLTALNSDPGIGMEEGDSCESLSVNFQELIAEVTYVHEDFVNDFEDLFDDDVTGVLSR